MYKGVYFPIMIDMLHPYLLKNYNKLSVNVNLNDIIDDKLQITEDSLLILSILKIDDYNNINFYINLIENFNIYKYSYSKIKINPIVNNLFCNGEIIEKYDDKYIYMFLPIAHKINSISHIRRFNFMNLMFKDFNFIEDIKFFLNCIFILNFYRRNNFKNIKEKFQNFIKEQYPEINLNENKNFFKSIKIFISSEHFELMLKEIYSLNINDNDKKNIAMFVSCLAGTIYEITSSNLMNFYCHIIQYLNKNLVSDINDFHSNIYDLFKEKWSPLSLKDRWILGDIHDIDQYYGDKPEIVNIEQLKQKLLKENIGYQRLTRKKDNNA